MPRAGAPEWKRRKQPVLDHLIAESIKRGFAELVYSGIETRERAHEIRRALYRSGKHVSDGQGSPHTSVSAHVEKMGDGSFIVRFRTYPKNGARDYIMKTYGEDRTKWPYSPWRHDPNFAQDVFEEPS